KLEKWSDFDSAIPRFESWRPSHKVRSLGVSRSPTDKAPAVGAFGPPGSLWRSQIRNRHSIFAESLRLTYRKFPFLRVEAWRLVRYPTACLTFQSPIWIRPRLRLWLLRWVANRPVGHRILESAFSLSTPPSIWM